MPTCPYHHVADCAGTRSDGFAGAAYVSLECGFPARICAQCGATSRTYARFCRNCAIWLEPHAFGAETGAVLKSLWEGLRRGEEPVVYPVSLPAGERIGVVALGWGFLFMGTSARRVLAMSAFHPDRVLTAVEVPEEVLALEPVPECGDAVPSLVVTTLRDAYHLPLLPLLEPEPLWNGASGGANAGPTVPAGAGFLGLRESGGKVEAMWRPWTSGSGAPRTISEPFSGPAGRPLRLPSGRVFFFGTNRVYLYGEDVETGVRSAQPALVPEVAYAASHEPETDEVLYVYRRGQEYGIARVSPSALDAPHRCTEAVYAAAQVIAINRDAMCVASDRDLEIRSPVTGEHLWSLRLNLHMDNLNLAEFQPIRTEGHLLLVGRTGGGGDSLFLMPLSKEGRQEGPRRVAYIGRAALPPVAVPGGVVCVPRAGAGGASSFLVVRSRWRKEEA